MILDEENLSEPNIRLIADTFDCDVESLLELLDMDMVDLVRRLEDEIIDNWDVIRDELGIEEEEEDENGYNNA